MHNVCPRSRPPFIGRGGESSGREGFNAGGQSAASTPLVTGEMKRRRCH
jgi:hypothetical protein